MDSEYSEKDGDGRGEGDKNHPLDMHISRHKQGKILVGPYILWWPAASKKLSFTIPIYPMGLS